MRILIAPNAFKGSLSPLEAAEAIKKAVRKVFKAETALMPVSDGGDGLIEVLSNRYGGKIRKITITGPVGSPLKTSYWLLKDGTAVIETAAICGLALMGGQKLQPLTATSRGVGEALSDALSRGAAKIYVGLGGSASSDGGAGMAKALGARFYDKSGHDTADGAAALKNLRSIDISELDPKIKSAEIFALSDVKNTILGKCGSARVYGPQKGASPAQVNLLEIALRRYAQIIRKDLRREIARIPGGAAAGGIAAGMSAFLDAQITPGADFVLDLLGAEEKIRSCDLVITGEGSLDRQTLFGKAPAAICRLAKKHSKPALFVTGRCRVRDRNILRKNGITLVSAIEEIASHEDAMKNAQKYLFAAAVIGLKKVKDIF